MAVIDTGLWWEADTLLSKTPKFRFDTTSKPLDDDPNGHGTHVSSIIASNGLAANWVSEGIAPRADIGAVRAFGADGSGSYIDVIEALDYVVQNKAKHNIRVLNLSFSAAPRVLLLGRPAQSGSDEGLAGWHRRRGGSRQLRA